MRLLLDTHAFLWFALSDPQLSPTADAYIRDPSNELFLSPASYWEIAIKISIGRYRLTQDFETFMNGQVAANGLTILPITVAHAAAVSTLPFHHRDPFDRNLIAQALVEQVPIGSADAVLDAYPSTRVW